MDRQSTFLRFLREELYTTDGLAQQWLGASADQYLSDLQKAGYLRTIACPELSDLLWGVTAKGQRYIAQQQALPVVSRCVRPSFRYALTTLFHKIRVQTLVWAVVSRGGALVQSARGGGAYGVAIPDAIVDWGGQRYAIEYERVLKARTRYPDILSERLQAIKRQEYDRIVWVLPTEALCQRLSTWLFSMRAVPVTNAWVPIRSAEHHPRMACVTEADWPLWLEKCLGKIRNIIDDCSE